jgi:hypothetical protein
VVFNLFSDIPPESEWFSGDYAAIPEYMRPGMLRYVKDHLKPGGFLVAVITNDLRGAVLAADDHNLPLIPLYVRWFGTRVGSGAVGSKEAMKKWLAEKPVTA